MKEKIYTRAQMLTAAFLGGFLVSFYMYGKNWKTLQNHKKYKEYFTGGFIAVIIISIALYFLPENRSSSAFNSFFALFFTLFEVNRNQIKLINQELSSGTQKQSWWNVFIVLIVGILLTVIISGLTVLLINIIKEVFGFLIYPY